jgi:MFS family permease
MSPMRPCRRPDRRAARARRVLVALIVGQLGLHAAMAGLRMAAPLQALREGYSAWAVGVLLALFAAAPVLLALHAGRLADRHGYHRPVRMAGAWRWWAWRCWRWPPPSGRPAGASALLCAAAAR